MKNLPDPDSKLPDFPPRIRTTARQCDQIKRLALTHARALKLRKSEIIKLGPDRYRICSIVAISRHHTGARMIFDVYRKNTTESKEAMSTFYRNGQDPDFDQKFCSLNAVLQCLDHHSVDNLCDKDFLREAATAIGIYWQGHGDSCQQLVAPEADQ